MRGPGLEPRPAHTFGEVRAEQEPRKITPRLEQP